MGVAVKSVQNWIDQGKLCAGRTPGGHRRISSRHFVSFLRKQNLPVPRELHSSTVRLLAIDTDARLFRSILPKIKSLCPRWEIQATYNLFAAGQLCESYQPNVILVNLGLADSGAFDICRRVRQAEATRNSVVIGVGNRADSSAKRKCIQAGASAFLQSPIRPRVLLDMIEQQMNVD